MYFWRIYRNRSVIYTVFRNDNMGVFEMIHNFFNELNKELSKFTWFTNQTKPLEKEFTQTVQAIKERNSQIVWTHYYIPKAIKQILSRDGYLLSADSKAIQHLATSMMFADLSDGTLTEFYKFKESEV